MALGGECGVETYAVLERVSPDLQIAPPKKAASLRQLSGDICFFGFDAK